MDKRSRDLWSHLLISRLEQDCFPVGKKIDLESIINAVKGYKKIHNPAHPFFLLQVIHKNTYNMLNFKPAKSSSAKRP